MMGTRAAAFAGKISNLRESLLRIQNGTLPQPTCVDLSNMLKYFCQVLHDFRDFKDIENVPLYASEKKDQLQLIKTLPNFDYCGLYRTLAQLIDIMPLIPNHSTGFDQLASNLLLLFKCLVPFLDQTNMETMPYLVSTLFMSLPQTMHKEILDTLCYNLLPFTIDQQQKNTAAMLRRAQKKQRQARLAAEAKARRRGGSAHQQSRASGRAFHCVVRIEEPSAGASSSSGDGQKTTSTEKQQQQQQQQRGAGADSGAEMSADDDDEGDDADHKADSNGKGALAEADASDEFNEDEYALLSVTSILMVSFHYIQEPAHHSQLVECLMKLKNNVFEDLLFVIAYGTTRARCPAVELLFRYWPDICPSQQDRKNNNQTNKLKHIQWTPTKCQNGSCSFTSTSLGDDEAVKMCLDFKMSITLSGLPPPMLVCLDCVDSIYKHQLSQRRDSARSGQQQQQTQQQQLAINSDTLVDDAIERDNYSNKFLDLLLPMERVSKLCENKKCRSTDRSAIGTCFDIECANYNSKRPIRYCRTCFVSIHEPCEANNFDLTLENHIRHSSLNLSIMQNEENINNFVEAIISLLKEAAPAEKPSKDGERHLRTLMGQASAQFIGSDGPGGKDPMSIATEEKQLISQYGIWLMTGLCQNVDKLSNELLGRLLGMLFQWFHFTACLPDDQAGSALEKLKGECIKGWIMEVKNSRLDVFISCLLPHPIDCSKIGGHWEVWPDTAHQIKEGFKRLLCLVPYDIITDDVWDEIMPCWMECFRHEVPENELSELKILLSKVFDPELSPLGFETKQMYNFISSRFEDSTSANQEQTLYWLQIITMLEIPIPINFLFQMLRSGVSSLAKIRASELSKMHAASRLRELNKQQRGTQAQAAETGARGRVPSPEESGVRESGHRLDGATPGTDSAELEGQDEEGEEEEEEDEEEDDGEDEEDQSGSMSVTEDDVLLPAESSAAEGGAQRKPLTQQERQAAARAAFSAKLMQQANLLDAQHSGAGAPTSGHYLPVPPPSTPASGALSLSVDSTVSDSAGPLQTRQAFPSSAGLPAKSQTICSGLGTASHRSSSKAQPLKSTAGSSSARDLGRKGKARRGGGTTAAKRGAGGAGQRPKLRLNLNSAEEQSETNGGAAPPISKVDNNLVCYILMMDILLRQLDLQEISSHRGLDGKEAQQAIELLNMIVSTPWMGKHTCCDSLPHVSSPMGAQSGSVSNSNTFSSSSVKQANGSSESATNSRSTSFRDDAARREQQANVHAFGHCAQGFEQEDSANETCVYCEIISTFFQLSMSLLEFFSPLIEVSICEVSQDAANGEFDGKPDYSRIGLDHLGPSPRELEEQVEGGAKFNFEQHHEPGQTKLDASAYSPSYAGPTLKAEVLSGLPKELQLSYNLLVQFNQYQTADIVSQLLQMIKLVSLHSQVLSRAAKSNPQFISWCQHNMLVDKLWSLCQLESSEIARTCVPILLHCITLPWGVRLFRDLVERDFNSDSWLSRFRAVERVVTIAYFCEPSTIKNSTLLQSTMASAFCHVVRCLDDIEAIVAQRALVSLEMMKTSSLKLLLWCLEVQFDYIIIDRPMILRSVFQLYNHLRDRRFLTWEFFLNRFDTVYLEAQIYLQQTGEIPSFTMQDLKNTNTKSEIYQKKIARAREALQETHHSRSLSTRFNESKTQRLKRAPNTASSGENHSQQQQSAEELQAQYMQSMRLQKRMEQATGTCCEQPSNSDASAFLTTSQDDNLNSLQRVGRAGAKLATSPMRRILQHGRSTSSRYQSVAYLTSQSLARRKNSRFMSYLALQSAPPSAYVGASGSGGAGGSSGGPLASAASSPLMSIPDKLHQHLPNSFVDDGSKLNEISQENHAFGVVHRINDEDRDTNHSLIFLLMQFFSKPDPSHPQSVKTMNRSHQIVLRHLNILMGYSMARRNFLISASNLRLLPVFNAFLTSLPKVLDFNYTLGTILLDTCLPVLIYCPAPHQVQFEQMLRSGRPDYSLWLLNPLMRQSWLMSVMTFLYKYQFGQQHLQDQVNALMWIVINTLESHLNTMVAEQSLEQHHHLCYGSTAQTHVHQAGQLAHAKQRAGEAAPAANEPAGDGHTSAEATPKRSTTVPVDAAKNIESIEMKNLAAAGSPPSRPTGEPSETAPSAKHELRSPRAPIIKAETSDNLSSRTSKLLQSKQQVAQQHQARSGRHFGAWAPQPSVAASTSHLAETATCSSEPLNEERLLPIGGKRVDQTREADSHRVERLLPIGHAPMQPAAVPSAAKHHQTLAKASSETSKEGIGAAAAVTTTGLRANLAGSLLHTSSSGAPCELQAQPAHPQTSSSSKAHKLMGRLGASAASFQSESRLHFSTEQSAPGHRHKIGRLATPSSSSAAGAVSPSVASPVADKREHHFSPNKQQAPSLGAIQAGMRASFSSPSLLNEQLAQLNRHSFVQEFSDKDLSLCLVILETFIHHEPSMAARMLPNILRLVARYSSASFESWQTGSNAHLVGGSMFVARQFIRVALHDLMENNIFQQIFTSHFTGHEFYKSMATALTDFADLNQLAPLSKLFEDLNKQKNLPQVNSLVTILENVATYFECITADSASHSQSTWNQFIMNWENFLRKLIMALPRLTGSAAVSERAAAAAVAASAASPLGGGASGTGTSPSASKSEAGGVSSAAAAAGAGANQAPIVQPSVVAQAGSSSGAASGSAQATAKQQQHQAHGAGAASQDAAQSSHHQAVQSSCTMIMAPIIRIILSTTKISHLSSCKTIVDPYSKIVSFAVLNSHFKYEHLLEINHNCCRLYTRDREKYLIQRTIAYELVQVLKFRFFILEENLLLLLLFVLQDVGGTLPNKVMHDSLKIDRATLNQADSYITNVSECLRQHIGDLLEFITDVHAISRINDNLIGSRPSSINRDSFGGHVKAAISQYLALEISLSHTGDQRTILRYLPWLYNSPSLQQGPREFIDCVSHIRQLSWLLLGSLQHFALIRESSSTSSSGLTGSLAAGASSGGGGGFASSSSSSAQCRPIPIEKNNNIAEHVQVILAGFAEQSKESVLHMSGLFHAFLLCQLWTMYCETLCQQHAPSSEQYQFCQSTQDDFWAKITPGVLRLVGHSCVMSDMVSIHFLQLIESLIESNSSVLIRYLPMWNSVFYSYKRRNKAGNLAIRLQKCIEWQPPDLSEPDVEQSRRMFISWLEKVQYKMSHIEIQSSQAAPFYLS